MENEEAIHFALPPGYKAGLLSESCLKLSICEKETGSFRLGGKDAVTPIISQKIEIG